MKWSGGRYFEPPQVNVGDDAIEKFLDLVLVAATICRQHLANKIPMKQLNQEEWREYDNTKNSQSAPKHSSQQIKKSAIMII